MFALYLKDFFPRHLDAAVASLWLLLGELLAEDLQLLHQVPFVFGHCEALGLLRKLTRGHQGLLNLLLQLALTTTREEKRQGEGLSKHTCTSTSASTHINTFLYSSGFT